MTHAPDDQASAPPGGAEPYDADPYADPYDADPYADPYDADPYDALVLAGDASRRLGGADKPAVTVGGRTLLDRVLAACAGAVSTTVVGPRRATYRPVVWAREDPPGGGPLAALEAGLREVRQATVLLLSADVPFLDATTVRELLDVREGDEGTVLYDGRDQPLLAAYRTEPLRRELALLRTEYGGLSGVPLRLLLPGLALRRAHVPPGNGTLDCDTWDDIATARARIRDHGTVLDEWIAAVKAELGIELDVETGPLLDLARDAAHGVARPAAPLTTFLVGYAAARAGGSPEDVADAARKAASLAGRWAAEDVENPEKAGNTKDVENAKDVTEGTEDGGAGQDGADGR